MDKEDMTSALSQWEEEGGAQTPAWGLRAESRDLMDAKRRALERLGAAVIKEWHGLSTDVQRAIFQHATTGDVYSSAPMKAQLARFLHDLKRHNVRSGENAP